MGFLITFGASPQSNYDTQWEHSRITSACFLNFELPLTHATKDPAPSFAVVTPEQKIAHLRIVYFSVRELVLEYFY